MKGESEAHYSFGDAGLASERLRRLSEAYAPASAALLQRAQALLEEPIRCAIDLGCGPGHTTSLLAESVGAERVVGIERSPTFLAETQARGLQGIEFLECDVSSERLPIRNADLAFSRFLLTHLPDPVATLGSLRHALRPGGLLILEELEHLSSTNPILSRYYEIVEGVQASHGQKMHIGPALEGYARQAGFEVLSSEPFAPNISAATMSSLHRPNLDNLRLDPWVIERFEEGALDELAEGLEEIARDEMGKVPIENILRHVIATAP